MSPDYANLIADFGLTNTQPLYLDDNNVLEYTLQVLELLKFSLWVLKIGGRAILYPTVVSFQLLERILQDNSFTILDWNACPTYGCSANSYSPHFLNAPVSYHVEARIARIRKYKP